MTVPISFHFLKGQIAFMKERGVCITALSSPGPELQAFSNAEQVEVRAVSMPRRISPVHDLLAVVRIWSHIRSIRPRVVHSHTPKGGLLGTIAARLAGVPVTIYHIRGLPLLTASGLKRRMLWCSEWLACSLADEVLCVSHSVRDVALRERVVGAQKIRVLAGGSGNGVDALGRFDPHKFDAPTRASFRRRHGIPANAVVIGFFGRIVRDKGIVELTDAWRWLSAQFPDAYLLVVGPFEDRDPIPSDVKEYLHTGPRIRLTGMVWETPPLFATADLIVLPTYREGFPNVPLEAAAMGLPVVTTNVPGCVDAVADGVTGTLVPAGDARALGDAIRRYLSDPDLRRRHGAAGRERVLREFRQEVIWEALFREYTRLLRMS
jgi:glycosyltransferase involved in cell wall biosynthesis